jgi:hypothetical protein
MRDRLKAKGMPPKAILIACARQLLVILNAMSYGGKWVMRGWRGRRIEAGE